MAEEKKRWRLVHLTTVPQTLFFLIGQAGYMRSRGFDVHAVSSPGKRLEEFGNQERIPIHAVPMARAITPMHDLAALWRLWCLFQKLSPTILHAHTPKGGLLGILAAALARVPVRIYHIHGLRFTTTKGIKRQVLVAAEKISCALAHQVLCVSPSVRELAVGLGLCSAQKIKVLGAGTINGIDAVQRFNPQQIGTGVRERTRRQYGIPENALVIGFIGRITRDKGVEDLVSAWERLQDVYPSLHMVIAGRFEPLDPISEQAQHMLRSHERIHLLGPTRDLAPVYAIVDVVVLPSYREGFPYVPMEAAAMGLPVVATRVVGCVDAVVDGVTGTLVPPRDPQALAEAIRRYLDDPDLRRRHGQAGRERVLRDFRPEAIWEATYQEYVRLLQERGLRHPTETHTT